MAPTTTTTNGKLQLIRAKKPDRPQLLVALYAPAQAGKTLLASKLPGSKLVFDADGRFMEQASADDEIYFAYETPAEMMHIPNITKAVADLVPDSDVQNIIIDTITMPFQQLLDDAEAMGSVNGNRHKASVMKALRRELFAHKRNVIVIYHTHTAGDGKGNTTSDKKTISANELARFDMSVNLTLKVVIEQGSGRRGVTIEKNRFGHSGITVWDDTGSWEGFWEKLQIEAYKGLTWADMNRIAASIPTSFVDEPAAWAWATEQGCFKDVAHARNAFAKMLRENEIDQEDIWGAWVTEVQERKANVTATTFASMDQAIDWAVSQGVFASRGDTLIAYGALRAQAKPANAKAMFALWINHVIDMKDAGVAPAPQQEPEPEPTPDQAPKASGQDKGEVSEKIDPYQWILERLPGEAETYAAEVQAAGNGTVVSRAQIASLRASIMEASGWADPEATFDGMPKADWVANILANRGYLSLENYPAGSAKLIFQQVTAPSDERKNPKFEKAKAEVVKKIAGIVDQAVALVQ